MALVSNPHDDITILVQSKIGVFSDKTRPSALMRRCSLQNVPGKSAWKNSHAHQGLAHIATDNNFGEIGFDHGGIFLRMLDTKIYAN